MAKTQAEMVTLILQKLKVLVGGETPATEDDAAVDTVYESRMEYLRDDEIVYFANGAVPDAVADPLAEYMSFFVAPIFLISENEIMGYGMRSNIGLAHLRRQSAKRSDGAPVKADYS